MANIPGSIPLTGFVAPNDAADSYPVQEDTYGKGGYRVVDNLTARDAVTSLRRKIGMAVYVISNDTTYKLKLGITNGHWVADTTSGSTTVIITDTVAPTVTQEVVSLPLVTNQSFVFTVDLDNGVENSHYQINAAEIGGTIDFVRSNMLGRVSDAVIDVTKVSTSISISLQNNNVTETLNVTVKVI